MSYYNVGDHVIVRSDLMEDEIYYNRDSDVRDSVIAEMMVFRGQEVEIRKVYPSGKYLIQGSGCNWTDEMFVGDECAEDPDSGFDDALQSLFS